MCEFWLCLVVSDIGLSGWFRGGCGFLVEVLEEKGPTYQIPSLLRRGEDEQDPGLGAHLDGCSCKGLEEN